MPHPANARIEQQSGVNLLVNGGFEYPYNEDFRGDGGGFIAHGWSIWFYNDPGAEYDGPEYKDANIEQDPFRVKDGVVAQQYFRPWARHLGGVYQRVQVPANSHVRFTVYGHAWSSFCEVSPDGSEEDCDPRNSFHGQVNPISMKVGIDPTGGTDPYSSAIVWSPVQGVYDNYGLFAVEAEAQGDYVTVYTYSTPEWPSVVINVYWDNAVLTATGGGIAPPPTNPPPTASSSGNNPPPAQQPTITPSPTPTTAVTPTASPTATPQEVAEVSESTTGQICLSLFEDLNDNGLRDTGEPLLPGGTLSVEGLTVASHATDGASEPFCFENLAPGDYLVTAGTPDGYHLTGLDNVPVTLSGGGAVGLSFGAAVGAVEELAEEEREPRSIPTATIGIAAIVGVIAVASLGGFGIYLFTSRQQA